MNAGTHTQTLPNDPWLDRIEQQLREQDEALAQALQMLEGVESVSIGIPGEALEEIEQACSPRRRQEIAPVFATRC